MDLNDKSHVQPYPKPKKDASDPPNIVHLLNARQLGIRHKQQLQQFAELKTTVSEMKETKCKLPPSVRSTFLMSFSYDCSKVASTHGDHNIYVSDVKTGKHIQKLMGHPRTPWSIAFHPTSNDILASGCLAGQVRVWDLHGGSELWKAGNDQVIASLAFHPCLQMLVIAVGNSLYFWDWYQPKPSAYCSTNSEIERVRFVKFDQYGHRLITGISNVNSSSNVSGCLALSESSLVSDNSDNDSRENYRTFRRIMGFRNLPDSEVMDSNAVERHARRIFRCLVNSQSETSSGQSSRSASVVFEDISREPSPEPITISISTDSSGSEAAAISPTQSHNNINQQQSEPFSDTVANGEIFKTFFRLRIICSDLEKHLMRQARNDDSGVILNDGNTFEEQNLGDRDGNSLVAHSSSGHRDEGTGNRNSTSSPCEPLLNMLARVRMNLRFSTQSLYVVRDRIDQIRTNITQILQRLRHLTGRGPVGQLHYPGPFEEMISQLYGQMERLIQADERIANSLPSSSGEQNSHQSVTTARTSVEQIPPQPTPSTSHPAEEAYSLIPGLPTPPLRVGNMHTVSDVPDDRNVSSRDVPQAAAPSVFGRSASNIPEDNYRGASSTPSRIQEFFPRHRFNPLAVRRTFRRNLTPQFAAISSTRQISTPSRRFHHQVDENNVISSAESDDESFLSANIGPLPRLALASRRRNVVNTSTRQDNALPTVSAEIQGLFRNGLDFRFDNISESSDEGDARPISPPLIMFSSAASLLLNGSSRTVISDQNHRIQSWTFSSYEIPAIYDANANIVVRRCMIHNDSSVDISQDGEKLVCLIPPEDADPTNNVMFGVFSLRPKDMGRILCVWGYVSNAISVSFSPLAQYVLMGSAYSRPIFSNPEKVAVAQIIKIEYKQGCYDASYVRSFTQVINNENRFQQVSLNCVRWLPQPGFGVAYATNRGCLSICKPVTAWIFDENELSLSNRRNRLRLVRAFMRPN